MYIRRKVFSVVLDENGEERYFSTNEFINEEDYLDEVLFSDDDEESEEKSHRGRNIAIGAGGAAALTGSGIYGAKKLGQHLSKSRGLFKGGAEDRLRRGIRWIGADRIIKKDARSRRQKVGDALQKPADWIVAKTKGSKKYITDKAAGAGKWISAHSKPLGIGAGVAAAAGTGYYGYKKVKNSKNNVEE